MTREQEEILNRVKLLMGYSSEKTLSENYQTVVKNYLLEDTPNNGNVSQSTVYNETIGKATYGNAKIVQDMFDNNTLTKEILKTFACDILKTPFGELVMVFEQICKNMDVGPTSDDIIKYSKSNTPNLVSWLVESQLMGNLKYWIDTSSISESNEKDGISKLIYVKSNPRKKIDKVTTYEINKKTGDYYEVYKDVQTIEYDRKQLSATDSQFDEYLKKLDDKKIILDPSDVLVIAPIKNELNKRFQFNEYPSAVRLCSSLITVSKEDSPDIKKQKEYALQNQCPAETLDDENDFRKWVNDNYPEIAEKLNLSPSTTKFCNSTVKTAAAYPINRNLVKKYDPTI